jgi:thioredoxin reductase (NADPH)
MGDEANISGRPGLTPGRSWADQATSRPLSDDHIATLRRIGKVRPTQAGEVLFREGNRVRDFFVILSGQVKLCDHQAGIERELFTWGAREFTAGMALLTGERTFTTAVITEPGDVLVVPVAKLRQLISRDQVLGDLILRTVLARRDYLLSARAGLHVIGSRSQPQTRRLLEFVARNRLPHVWLDIDADPAADVVLRHHATPRDQTPVVVMRGGKMLRDPSNAELARAAGIGTAPEPGVTYDVAIIGAGPAGLGASVYGASEGLSTVVIDELAVGGQIGTTSKVENYLGFPVGISGSEFAQRAFLQVLRFGASIVLPASAAGLSQQGSRYLIHLDTGDDITALSVIIATGASYRQIEADGLDRFSADDVFYTPSAVYDRLRPGQPAVIVGGGNSAGQAAIALADNGSPATIVIRGTHLATDMSQYLVDRIIDEPEVNIRYDSEVRKLDGSDRLEWVIVEDRATSALDAIPANALFVMIGAEPRSHSFRTAVQVDAGGYIVTGPGLGPDARHQAPWTTLDRDPYMLETSMPGVFAAGDVRSGSVKRVASAAGEGSIAIRFVSEHLGRRVGLAPGPAGAYQSVKGLNTWASADSKSLVLRVITVKPCTRAVAATAAASASPIQRWCRADRSPVRLEINHAPEVGLPLNLELIEDTVGSVVQLRPAEQNTRQVPPESGQPAVLGDVHDRLRLPSSPV